MPEDDVTQPLPEDLQPRSSAVGGQLLKGRYRIQKELGRGGFGVVYLAEDTQLLSKLVVVKILTLDAADDAWILKKFNQEMEALSRINHPGVIGSLDAGQTAEGKPFLVMQYVEGGSLRAEIREGGIEIARAAGIVRQTGQALSAAHDKGIWHRDIKPENILLQRAAEGEEYAKLIDFGIASGADSQFEASGMKTKVAGSFSYMAPEQFQAKAVAQSDVYSLGVVAYELITGKKPFPDASVYDLIMNQQKGPAARPCQLRPDLPAQAEQVILKALAYEPENRYLRPREFGDELHRACTGGQTQFTAAAAAVEAPRPAAVTGVQTMDPNTPSQLEVAHVLFLDIVGYSTLAMDQQTQYLRELNQVVRETAAFQKAEQAGSLIRLPTGDGMALTFFGNPTTPVECAVEIAARLKSKPHLLLRTGVHTGPVYRVADINTNMNVSGGGINMAQRVMDAGDAGHILVSAAVADILLQLSAWRDSLTDLGEVSVKHGVKVRIYNLCTGEVGNAAVPKKVKPPEPEPGPSRRGLVIAAAVVVAAAAGGGYYYWSISQPPPAPPVQRTLQYSITVQKYAGEKPDGAPMEYPGEMIYTADHRIRVNLFSNEAGHLYILNLGPAGTGKDSFVVLYPPLAAGASSAVKPPLNIRYPAEGDGIRFDTQRGTERMYLVWSATQIPLLESAAAGSLGDVVHNHAMILEQPHMKDIQDLLAKLTESNQVDKNVELKRTTVRSTSDALAHLIKLEHY